MTPNLHIIDHPLVRHKITILRNKETDVLTFRNLIGEIALLIGYEATRDLKLTEVDVETPLVKTKGSIIEKQVTIVPILRAGLGMVDSLMSLIPAAKIGHVGLYRDHDTLKPVEYYWKMPTDVANRQVIVTDPMLATGGSAIAAVDGLKRRGVKHIKLMCIIAAPEGVEAFAKEHPDVEIFCGMLDECLNENGYIVPGLGDAGDRLFGTL